MDLKQHLENAPANSVVYSHKAWAAARKSSSGGQDGLWFPDHGSHSSRALTSQQVADWADDWALMQKAPWSE